MTAKKPEPHLIDLLRGNRSRATFQEEMREMLDSLREMLDSLTPKTRALLRKRFAHDEAAIKEINASDKRAGKS